MNLQLLREIEQQNPWLLDHVMSTPEITRGYRSFLQAYQPKQAAMITKDFIGSQIFEGVPVEFIPLAHLTDLLNMISKM